MDPERMMDDTTDPLELTLLQAGRADGMSEASRHGILTSLGLMLPLASLSAALPGSATLPGNAGAATAGELPSGVSPIDPGPVGRGVDSFGSQSGVVQTSTARTELTQTAELGTTSGAGTVSGAGAAGSSAFAAKGLVLAAAAIVTGALAIWSTESGSGAGDAIVAGGESVAAGTDIATGSRTGAVASAGNGALSTGESAAGQDRRRSEAGNDVADGVRGVDVRNGGSRSAESTAPNEPGSSVAQPGMADDSDESGSAPDHSTEQGTETATGNRDERAEAAARTSARGTGVRGQAEDRRVRRPKAGDGSRVARARSSDTGGSPAERGAKPSKKQGQPGSEDVSTLSVELELIDSARKALRSSSPRASLQKLDEYGARFPNGRLRTEATILRIEALMAAGDRAAASRLGKSVLDRAPNSPYARRVRSLLGDE